MNKLSHAFARMFGHDTVKYRSPGKQGVFQIFQYHNADGSFNYEKYERIQTEGNRKKLDKVWVREENIAYLANYIRSVVVTPEFGLCHGTRRGNEQFWFRKYLNCTVIGTEISDTATNFPFTIRWDFHDTKPEWINSVDFIYSNSLDHSFDPEQCLSAWMSCIREGGVCILEHTSGHEVATRLDPFGAELSQMLHLIMTWGEGQYYVRETLDAPSVAHGLTYAMFIIVQRI